MPPARTVACASQPPMRPICRAAPCAASRCKRSNVHSRPWASACSASRTAGTRFRRPSPWRCRSPLWGRRARDRHPYPHPAHHRPAATSRALQHHDREQRRDRARIAAAAPGTRRGEVRDAGRTGRGAAPTPPGARTRLLTSAPSRRLGPRNRKAPLESGAFECGREDSNLHGPFSPQGPQPCASTNSATAAWAGSIALAPRPAPPARGREPAPLGAPWSDRSRARAGAHRTPAAPCPGVGLQPFSLCPSVGRARFTNTCSMQATAATFFKESTHGPDQAPAGDL